MELGIYNIFHQMKKNFMKLGNYNILIKCQINYLKLYNNFHQMSI